MTIADALRACKDDQGWSTTRLAYEAGVTEGAARRWLAGDSIPPGDKLLKLRRKLPGLAEMLEDAVA